MQKALRVALLLTLGGTPAPAQTPLPPVETLGTYVGAAAETRTVLTFKVRDEAVQKLLPAGWTLAPVPQGPAKGANLAVVFAERMATLDAAGKPSGGEEATIVLSVPAKNDAESAFAIIAAYGDGQTVPGFFYKTAKPAKVAVERALRVINLSGTVAETWSAAGDGGERIAFHVGYERSQPARVQLDSRNVSAVDGAVRRTYRIDQGVVVLKSVPNGVDQVKALTFEASGGLLGSLFDGSQQMISAVSLPWYLRQMYVPAP